MNRRKGVVIGKLQASILASILFATQSPILAADSVPIQAETSIKTLPPLAATPVPGEGANISPVAVPDTTAGSGHGNLQFTPESQSVAQLPPGLGIPGAPPPSVGGGAVEAPTPISDRPADQTDPSAAVPIDPQMADPTAVQQAPAPTGDAAAPDTTEAPAESSPSAVVPPEVTPPTPVQDASSADGREIAQNTAASPTSPDRRLDPAYRVQKPTLTGTVQIRKNFRSFASAQLIHNLSFRDTPVREVIAEIARRGNLNVVIDKSVVGRITGDLHDVTLNEAMDSVLASAGLGWRILDNATVIIGTQNALYYLGLNRPYAKVFKLSYATAFDVANILFASVFNKGILPDFSQSVRNRFIQTGKENPITKTAETTERQGSSAGPMGGAQITKTQTVTTNVVEAPEDRETGEETALTSRPDTLRNLRGSQRSQVQEGTGFNNAAVDPGSQVIRAINEVVTDYAVEQNGGGAIVVPDVRNRQVVVVGTQDDLQVAEECIRLLDRRPKMIHVQSSLVELTNQGLRQLGASISLQGEGASGSILGTPGAPLISFLPGLGSPAAFLTQVFRDAANNIVTGTVDRITGIPPLPVQFNNRLGNGGTQIGSVGSAGSVFPTPTLGQPNFQNVSAGGIGAFGGLIGLPVNATGPAIAGIQGDFTSQSGFNFLTLSKKAGGRSNIATVPVGANVSLDLALQTNKAKVLANPSVTVTDNTESLITLANEVVHKVTTTVSLGVVSTNVELVKAGIFLNVLPRATEDGFVTMRIRPQVSSPLQQLTFAGGSVIVTLLNVREVMSQEVRVKDGQTLVIGGLFTEQEAANLSKVPYLAEAPIVGALFRNSLKGRNRTELMLLITPKVVEEPPPAAVSDSGPVPTL